MDKIPQHFLVPPAPETFSRRARLSDFFDNEVDGEKPIDNKHQNHHSRNDSDIIGKNQKEFGHRKRIKP